MYVRTKKIGNGYYNYLVEGKRVGKKVVQKHIRYLGKTPFPYTPKIKYSIEYDKEKERYTLFAQTDKHKMRVHSFEHNSWETEYTNKKFVKDVLESHYIKDFAKNCWEQNYTVEGNFAQVQKVKGGMLNNKEAHDAYHYYIMNRYRAINQAFRLDMDKGHLDKSKLDNLDKFCKTFSMSKNQILWRGTSEKYFQNLEVGDTFTDKGFCSTSISRSVAHGYYNNNLLFKIRAKKGQIFGAGDYRSYEYILPRNTSFKVVSRKKTNKKSNSWYTIVELEII